MTFIPVSISSVNRNEVGLRLTLTTALPVTTADVTGATTIYWTPYTGGDVALYTNSTWKQYTITEKSIALGTLTSAKPYDVFAYDNAGTVTLELSAAWSSASSRTDALATQDGVLVKSSNHSRRYIGTFYTTSTTATADSVLNRNLWNMYNRVPRRMFVTDASQWAYTTASWRAANNNTANSFNYVAGQADVLLRAKSVVAGYTGGGTVGVACGVGIDSTTTNSADIHGSDINSTASRQFQGIYQGWPGLGYHTITWVEFGGANANFLSNPGNPWQLGMDGWIEG